MAAPAVDLFGSNRMWGLQEPPLPDIPWFLPSTPAWGAVALLVVVGLVWWLRARRRRWQRDAWRRDAWLQIDAMRSDNRVLGELPQLLRRCAFRIAPRAQIAALRGAAWRDWLNAHGASFDARQAELLDQLPYAAALATRLDARERAPLLDTASRWITALPEATSDSVETGISHSSGSEGGFDHA